jgi:hypothetical protein
MFAELIYPQILYTKSAAAKVTWLGLAKQVVLTPAVVVGTRVYVSGIIGFDQVSNTDFGNAVGDKCLEKARMGTELGIDHALKESRTSIRLI